MLNQITMTAGQRLEFHEPGDFFRILAASAALEVQFYAKGKEIAEAVGVGAGYAEKFDIGQFDRIAITSPSAQTVQFVTRLGNVVQYDTPPVGNVQLTGGNLESITQPVNVAEMAYLRELTNRYGVGHQFLPATAGQNHRYILSNPAGSGKTLKVDESFLGMVSVTTAVMRAYICDRPASGAATVTPIKYNPANAVSSVASLVLVQNKGSTAGAGLVAGYTVLQELDLMTSATARTNLQPPEVFIPEGCSLVFDVDGAPTSGIRCYARWAEI